LADKPILIGVCGAPRAGKDMVANHLVSTYFPAAKTTISDSIIAEVNEALAGRHLITHGNKSAPLYRRLLQEWGQARADQDPEYWTRQTFAVVEERFAAGDRLVLVTGIRRPAEVEEIQARGGELWMIKRPDNDYRAEHPVEEQLRQIEPDLIIENLGDRSNCLRTAEREIEVRFRGDPEPDRR
jgi:hypothetical protein